MLIAPVKTIRSCGLTDATCDTKSTLSPDSILPDLSNFFTPWGFFGAQQASTWVTHTGNGSSEFEPLPLDGTKASLKNLSRICYDWTSDCDRLVCRVPFHRFNHFMLILTRR